ncbi:unnamed protein product, partial [Cyprideis torosa]
FLLQIDNDGTTANVSTEIDGGIAHVKLTLPAVITADLRLNIPRYATLPNIMKARKKKIEEYSPEDLGIDIEPHQEIIEVSEPPARVGGNIVGSLDDLIEGIRSKGHI